MKAAFRSFLCSSFHPCSSLAHFSILFPKPLPLFSSHPFYIPKSLPSYTQICWPLILFHLPSSRPPRLPVLPLFIPDWRSLLQPFYKVDDLILLPFPFHYLAKRGSYPSLYSYVPPFHFLVLLPYTLAVTSSLFRQNLLQHTPSYPIQDSLSYILSWSLAPSINIPLILNFRLDPWKYSPPY